MPKSFAEPGMRTPEKKDVVPGREVRSVPSETETARPRVADAARKTEFRTAIEASTARIISIALTRGIDPDPEAA